MTSIGLGVWIVDKLDKDDWWSQKPTAQDFNLPPSPKTNPLISS